jgi:hypothetical protein
MVGRQIRLIALIHGNISGLDILRKTPDIEQGALRRLLVNFRLMCANLSELMASSIASSS